MVNISVIGAGNVGITLGKKWAEAGHSITFGVRNPADLKYVELTAIGKVTTISESISGTEVILLSIPGTAVSEFAAQFGTSLAGKIVIDSTNNPHRPVMNNLVTLQSAAPAAHIIRAFSTLGWENFANPQLAGLRIDLFFACSVLTRLVAEKLIGEIGLRPVYVGDLDTAPLVDGLTRLWFALAFEQGRGRRIAFNLLEE